MRTQDFVRVAAGVLATAFFAAGAAAQGQREPPTIVDTAPLPAQDRASTGAVILMDEPVLAQREAMQTAQERSGVDTRTLGAGPSRMLRPQAKDEAAFEKALRDAMRRQGGTPK